MKSTRTKPTLIGVSSPAFEFKGNIPVKYTSEGENVNPPLNIWNLPLETKSLALILDDPDAPKGIFNQWCVWNITPTELIEENSVPGIVGKNSAGKTSYQWHSPKKGGSHRYFFKVYALDAMLDISEGADKTTVENAMRPHVVGSGGLIGHYEKAGDELPS